MRARLLDLLVVKIPPPPFPSLPYFAFSFHRSSLPISLLLSLNYGRHRRYLIILPQMTLP